MLVSSFSSRSPDAAAAGEHNFGAAIVPAVHLSGDLLIAIELTAVVVVHLNVNAQLLCCSISALNIAVTIADNGGHRHAAQEAQLGEAVLDSCIASQVAGFFFLKGHAEHVFGDGAVLRVDIKAVHINCDEVNIRILGGSPSQSRTIQVTNAYDGVCAIGDSLTDQGLAVFIASVLAGRQVVVVLDAVLIAVALNSFPAALVEAFIVQGANIAALGNAGDVVRTGCFSSSSGIAGSLGRSSSAGRSGAAGRAAASSQRECHAGSHGQSKILFHV